MTTGPLRILIVTGIFPPDIGGPATYVPQIATALAERGHNISVVTLSDHPTASPQNLALDHDYPFQVVRILRKIWKPWRWVKTTLTIVRLGRKAHVLFVNGLAMETVLANILLRKPIVEKVVGDLAWERATAKGWVRDGFEEFQNRSYGLKVEALKAFRAWWTRRAHKVIVPSRYLAKWITNWGVPEDKIVVIYNTLEPLNGIRPAAVPLRMPLKVVTVGRLVPWKGVDQILEAVSQLREVGLMVIGDGPERAKLEEQVRSLGMTDRTYFAGAKSKAETLALMAGCDLFVLNSTYEGLPHVVLEAMSLGLPVVATAVGGTAEVVEDGRNGRLIETLNGGALYEALSNLLTNSSGRLRLGEGARQTVARFNLGRMVQETEKLLTAVVSEQSYQ